MIDDLVSASQIRKSKVEYLVQAENEAELEDKLDKILRWVDDECVEWKPIGGVVNTDVFGNLTDSMTALVENVTNASDAYLLQKYDGKNYVNCFEAADALLDEETIKMRFDGDKPSSSSSGYSVTFSDSAHGQSRDDFDVFVNPLQSGMSKQEYGFLQGCRGVGSITALGHTKSGYKLIASAEDGNPESWTWTLIKSGPDNAYYYLTIDGEFPTFEGEFDCGDGIGTKSHGTVVKLYNYQLTTNPKDVAGGDVFQRELSRYMPETVVPIEIYDTRYDSGSYTYRGIRDEIEGKSEFFNTERFQKELSGIGSVEVEIYTLLPDGMRGEFESKNRYISSTTKANGLVCVNGQTHHSYTRSQISNLLGMEYCSKNSIVVVHLMDNKSTVGESLFNSGRTGFSDKSSKRHIEKRVFEDISDKERLREIENEYKKATEDDSDKPEYSQMVDIQEEGDELKVSIDIDQSDKNVVVDEPMDEKEESDEDEDLEINEDEIVESVLQDQNLNLSNMDTVLNKCFTKMVSNYQNSGNRNMNDFQSVASSVGSVFEAYFEITIEELFDSVTVKRDVELEDAIMVDSGAADAVIYSDNGDMLAIVELKGNPKKYVNEDGEVVNEASCSGLERSDTVKKAVCQAYQASKGYPEVPFFVVSNNMPSDNTSPDKVLSLAEGEIIDQVIDVTSEKEVKEMISELQ